MLPASQGVPTDSELSLQFQFHGLSQLAAPARTYEKLESDIQVYIHESAFPNLIQPLAGGDVWTDEFFARIQREAIGDNSVEMRIREHEDRWSLILDWMQPWSTRITKDGVRFTLNASGFSIDGKRYSNPLVIESTFVVVRDVGQMFGWERVGDVEISSPTTIDSQTREFLNRKLSGFFLDRIFLDGLKPHAGGAWDELSKVNLVNVQLDDGWLQMQFERTSEASAMDP